MQNKITTMALDQEGLQKKNEELSHAFKEKSRKLLQTQELYDKLKRKAMMGQMQDAAEDAVDLSLRAAAPAAGGEDMDTVDFNPAVYQEPGTPFRQSARPLGDVSRPSNMYAGQSLGSNHGEQWPRTIKVQC